MDYALSRFNMVEGQIKTNRVTDPYVIDAMTKVPREAFVPGTKKGIAYIDDAIEVAPGRHMLEPMILARMLEAAEMSSTDMALDLGCNTGYSSALLAQIVSTVVALECDEELAESATDILSQQGADNVIVVTGKLEEGVPKQGPYDIILFNGSVETIPETLKDQLAEGGRMVVIQDGPAPLSTVSVLYRNGDVFSQRDIMEGGVSKLPGFQTAKGFTF